MKKKLMIIDGNSIINRAYYGIRMLTNKDGLPTNAELGFLNIYYKNFEEINPDYVLVAFDLKAPTFRHKMYDKYKAQRKGMPDDLAVQLPVLKDVLSAMNVKMLSLSGFEADDIIGTVSEICGKNDVECAIITGDKDDLQLAGDNTKIYLTVSSKGQTTTTIYGSDEVFEKYGVTPTEFIDVKALMGDSSDNIPGVSGIGEKTALSLIQANKSIENLYENIENCGAKGKTLEKLVSGKDDAFLSKKLSIIDKNIPLDFSLEDAALSEVNHEKLFDLLNSLELKSIIKKLSLEGSEKAETLNENLFEKLKKNIIEEESEALSLKEKLLNEKEIAVKIYKFNSSVSAVAFLLKNDAYYIPSSMFFNDEEILEAFREVFESEEVKKIGINMKDDIVMLKNYGIDYRGIDFDIAIADYILDPSSPSYTTSKIAYKILSVLTTEDEEFFGKGKSASAICDIDNEKALDFSSKEVFLINALKKPLCDALSKNDQMDLFLNIEMPLIETLAQMQLCGMKVDKERLLEFGKELEKRSSELTREIYDIVGYEFNINSTKQLGEALFDKLGLPVIKKTKTGYSTDADVLDKLRNKHEIIDYIIEYRLINKIKSTYVDGLLAVINPKTGRIHSSFNQTVTVTGRISSTEPNMQNIPVRHPLGREIRKMFVAKEGYSFVDADYSQIELRVLAHISEDANMIKAFSDGVDIHKVTASQVMGVKLDEVTDEMRSAAKAVNFGIVYGIGEYSLSQDLKISVGAAKKYIEDYLNHYKGVSEYMARIKKKAEEDGFVETLFKRRRYIPELKSTNFNMRSFGQRVALNTPVQGTAADIIKLSMVKVFSRLKEEKLDANLILQVHDELIVEARDDEVEKVKKLLQEEMENAVSLLVKLKADANSGKSWYEAK